MGKITVKHYLNKSTRGNLGVEVGHPIYVQVTVKRQVNRMRSQAEKYNEVSWVELKLTAKEFESLISGKTKEIVSGQRILKAIELETEFIEQVINYLSPFERENFSISHFTDIYNIASEDIGIAIDKKAKALLIQILFEQWHEVYYMINWERSFIEIMEGLIALGSTDEMFKTLVLDNQLFTTLKVAIENIYLFLNTSNEVQNKPFKDLAFYWIVSGVADQFGKFLLSDSLIKEDERQLLESLFDDFSNETASNLKSLSNK